MKVLRIILDVLALQVAAVAILYPLMVVAKREDERTEKRWSKQNENQGLSAASDEIKKND